MWLAFLVAILDIWRPFWIYHILNILNIIFHKSATFVNIISYYQFIFNVHVFYNITS